jgi:hypothetical protein
VNTRELRETKTHDGHAPVLSAQKVRQGAPLGHIRYVLVISTLAAAAAGAIIWFAFFA